jgi:hypothetical protein
MKKIVFVFAIIFLGIIACEKDEFVTNDSSDERVLTRGISSGLDCPDIKMVPFKGHTIEVPYFDAPIFCNDIPYPSGFKDVGGKLTHLGDVTGGYLEFQNCEPDALSETAFSADFTGEFVSANGDKVFYEGTLIFDVTIPGGGYSNCVITHGTGRWKNAKGCFRYENATPLDDGTLKVYVDGRITPPGVK